MTRSFFDDRRKTRQNRIARFRYTAPLLEKWRAFVTFRVLCGGMISPFFPEGVKINHALTRTF